MNSELDYQMDDAIIFISNYPECSLDELAEALNIGLQDAAMIVRTLRDCGRVSIEDNGI